MVENIHYIFLKNVLIFPNVASAKIGKALPLMENFKLAKEIRKEIKKENNYQHKFNKLTNLKD